LLKTNNNQVSPTLSKTDSHSSRECLITWFIHWRVTGKHETQQPHKGSMLYTVLWGGFCRSEASSPWM